MAATEKFIEQIIHSASRTIPDTVRPECLFFGFSEPCSGLSGRVETQAALLHYRLGSILIYRLYVSDTAETSGYLGSQFDHHQPETLEMSASPHIIVPGCVPDERAIVERGGGVSVTVKGEALRRDGYYKEQLAINLALLTLEC